MTRRFLTILLCSVAVAAALRAAPDPVTPAASAPPAAEKKSDLTPPTVTVTVDTPSPPDPKAKSKSTLKPADLAKLPVSTAPLSPRFLQVRAHINGLFAIRNDPPAPPDPRFNPFRPPGAIPPPPNAPVAAGETAGEPVPTGNNLTLLQQAIARINVRGIVQRTNPNRFMVSVSTGPGKLGIYGEGDVINVNLTPEPAPVRIQAVTRNSVTFKLGDAEMMLRF